MKKKIQLCNGNFSEISYLNFNQNEHNTKIVRVNWIEISEKVHQIGLKTSQTK